MAKFFRTLGFIVMLPLQFPTLTSAQTATFNGVIPHFARAKAFSADQSFSRNNAPSGLNPVTCADPLNGVAYVGGSCTEAWGGGDIGSQINAAYTAFAATGGRILVIPQSAGLCYNFATPILFTTSSKYVLLEGAGPDSQTGRTSNGACLNYTPTTATTAVTMDYVPSNGGGGTRNHGIRNLRLINNQCNTIGGCSSSATGFSCASTNAGCQNATFDHTSIIGFGTGLNLTKPASSSQASWGVLLFGGACSYNTTCLSIGPEIEMVKMEDEVVLGNATGITMGASSDFSMSQSHCDSNTVVCAVSTGGSMSFTDVHWENLGSNGMAMLNCGLYCSVKGGFALDDCNSSAACGGVTPMYWFNSAAFLDVEGLMAYTGGRLPTHVFQYGMSARVMGFGNIGGVFPKSNIITTVGGNAVFNQLNAGPASIEAGLFMADSSGGGAFSCKEVSNTTGWGSKGACSNPQGGNQRFQFTMTAAGKGITSNPVVLVTLASPWPSAPFYQCKMVGGSAPPALITGEQTTISTTTIGPMVYVGTPSAGQTVIFSCLGM